MPRGTAKSMHPGDRVVVQHGRDAIRGELVGIVVHPVFGKVADVRRDDGTVTRHVADRVSRDNSPAPAQSNR